MCNVRSVRMCMCVCVCKSCDFRSRMNFLCTDLGRFSCPCPIISPSVRRQRDSLPTTAPTPPSPIQPIAQRSCISVCSSAHERLSLPASCRAAGDVADIPSPTYHQLHSSIATVLAPKTRGTSSDTISHLTREQVLGVSYALHLSLIPTPPYHSTLVFPVDPSLPRLRIIYHHSFCWRS